MAVTSVYKKINKSVGKAVHQYEMISDGDKIAVGLSGGADSLSLMFFLTDRLTRVPVKYEVYAVYIDPGFEEGFAPELEAYCRKMNYSLRVDQSDFGIISHTDYNRENPCFLCSRLRRKRLFEIADELGCRKLALGHNKDDIIETLFLNMCYAGEISTMLPSQSLFDGRFTVIRPLAFADEPMIRRFAEERRFPEFHNPCPSAGTSKRQEIKQMLNRLYRRNPKIKGNIFRSMSRVKLDYLL